MFRKNMLDQKRSLNFDRLVKKQGDCNYDHLRLYLVIISNGQASTCFSLILSFLSFNLIKPLSPFVDQGSDNHNDPQNLGFI